jgi:hypothetical protein
MESQKKAQQKYFQKMKNDPDFKANRRKNVKAYYDRKKLDPEFMSMRNEKAKAYYKNNREKVLEKKKLKYSISINKDDETDDSNTDLQ